MRLIEKLTRERDEFQAAYDSLLDALVDMTKEPWPVECTPLVNLLRLLTSHRK